MSNTEHMPTYPLTDRVYRAHPSLKSRTIGNGMARRNLSSPPPTICSVPFVLAGNPAGKRHDRFKRSVWNALQKRDDLVHKARINQSFKGIGIEKEGPERQVQYCSNSFQSFNARFDAPALDSIYVGARYVRKQQKREIFASYRAPLSQRANLLPDFRDSRE